MRIIAGQFKGRKLLSPPGSRVTRPITGSVKKSLFDMLSWRLAGAEVLDLYCGTGTLGLEAISRGAGGCCFADRDPAAIARLRRNIETVGAADRCTVWRADVERRLAGLLNARGGAVDLAFVDPPYAAVRRWDWRVVERSIFQPITRRLSADGLVVLRTPADAPVPGPVGELQAGRVRRYGGMIVTIFEKKPAS